MNHRIEKLSTLLDATDTQLNNANRNKTTIERKNRINETSDNRGLSAIIVQPLSCNVASNEGCTTSSQLNIHNRIHSKQKRFTCDQCQKTFAQKSSLILHKRLHSGEKPYQCDVCQKKFSHLSHFKRHKKSHA